MTECCHNKEYDIHELSLTVFESFFDISSVVFVLFGLIDRSEAAVATT